VNVSQDAAVQKTDEFTVPSSGADVAYSKYKPDGNGLSVAIVDSGIRVPPGPLEAGSAASAQHNDLASVNLVAGEDTPTISAARKPMWRELWPGNGSASHEPPAPNILWNCAQSRMIKRPGADSEGRSDVSTVIAGIQWS